MSLQLIIAQRLESSSLNSIAMQMGYSHPEQAVTRLESVISDCYMALDSNLFDLRYSNSEFINKLCEILKIPSLVCEKVISEIEAELLSKKQQFKSYIFIETDFKRENEPIFLLASLESKRQIFIDEKTRYLSLNEQLSVISDLIKSQHLKQPVIDLWGEPKKYIYYYNEKTTITFSTSGDVIDASEEYDRSTARMSLK